MQTVSYTSVGVNNSHRRRENIWLDENARNIADLALATCEEKLAETRRRKRPSGATTKNDGYSRGIVENNNPYLARLGSPFVISRSMQGTNTVVNINNVHPLKDTRVMMGSSSSKRNARSSMNADDDYSEGEEAGGWRKLRRKLSPLDAPTYTILVLFLTLIILPKGFLLLKDRLLKWHALSDRHLNGRRCVMNLFVDKQKPDEWNPDWIDPKVLKKDPTKRISHKLEDTYRTKGHLKIITRFISCVADSFRTNLKSIQHVVFTGTRDGGHLAEETGKYWPPRGTVRTRLHIFAGVEDKASSTALAYDNVALMEKRFTTFNEYIYLYDPKGNVAGVIQEELPEDIDDDEVPEVNRKRIPDKNLEETGFDDILWKVKDDEEDDEDEDEDGNKKKKDEGPNIISYFHIDGESFDAQMDILEKARPLMETNAIASIGIEHSNDLDINKLIDFFLSVNFKTFMLGLRQMTRIDNVCPETLENILDHPTFTRHKMVVFDEKNPGCPPFFVAFPKGRHSLEEMTIQTMYDLFSGEGGGGQVKTANDRKAPGKK
mmetsp:Transcript_38233/g.43650  ORF Transcript_38233/g.43650 Transcript_38233/m.43650 type:complete len:547 (-) Transcript_38233:309-1949(-)|eukprot:CAMPEP_0194143536 /NCGR_PEP_ID=MMETSP0152-20130528/12693_1 /TAXON_ID=1049557 /ORGANISM="Thalassiothrix antarctica, Strain L6-D1" /LENGTH=546 /DNA_ID=CAMNT_0038842995 /DNA_START=343 /DNA_END=1983 /DNA_ORIENTATION=-